MSSGTSGVLNEVRSIVVKVRRRVLSVSDMLVAVACKVEDELRLDTGLSLPSLQLFCARCVLGAFVVGMPEAFVGQLLAAVPDAARPQARAAARRLLKTATASHHTLASFFARQDQRDAPAPLAPVPAQSFLRRLAAQWRAYGYREQTLCYESLAPALAAVLVHPLLAREGFPGEAEMDDEEEEEEEEDSQDSDGAADAYFNAVVRSVGVAGCRGASSPETGVDLAAKLQKKGPATRVQAAPEVAAVEAVEEALRCGVVDGVAVGAAAAAAQDGVEDAEAGRRRLLASNTHVLVRYLGEAGYRSEAVEAALAHCSEVITKNADSLTHGVASAGAGAGASEADGGGGGGGGAAGGPAGVPHLFSYDVLCGSAGAEAPRPSKMPLKNLCGATLVHIAYLHAKYADAASAKLCIDEAVKAGLNLSNPSLISASCHLNVLLCLKNQGAPFPGCHHLSRNDTCAEAEQAGPAASTAAAAAQAPQQNQQQSAAADAFTELVYTLRVANGASPAIHAQLQLTLAVLCLNFPVLSSAYAEQLSEFVPGLRRDVVCWHHHNGGDGLPPAMPPAAGGGGGGDDAPQAPAAPPVDRGETVIEGFSGGHAGCYHRGQQHGRNIGGVIGAATAVGDGQGGGVSAAHAATVAQAFLRGARGGAGGGGGTGTEASAAEVRSILAAPEAAWAWTSVGGDGVHYPLVPQILCALREAALHSATANPQFATAPSLADYYGRRGAEGGAGGGFGLSHGAAWAAATIAVLKSQVYDMAGLHDVALAALREGGAVDGPLSLHGRNRVLQLVVHHLFVRMDPVAAADACLSLRAAHGAAATAPLWEPRFQQASSLVLAYFLLHYGSDPAAAVRVLRRALALQTQGLPTPDNPVVLQPYLGLLLVACYLHPALADHEAALHECMASLESAREACLSRWVVVFQIQAVKVCATHSNQDTHTHTQVHLHCECGGMAARFLLNALRTADDADLCTERAEALAASVAHHLACDDVARAHTLLASVHGEHGSHTTADVRFQLCLLSAQTLMRIAALLADGTYTSDVRRDLSTPPPAPRAAAGSSDEHAACASSAAAAEVDAGSAFLPDLDWTRKDEDEAAAGVWFPGPTGEAVRLRERGGALRLALAHLRHAAEGHCLSRDAATQAVPPLLAYQAHALHAELREMTGEPAERDAAAVAALQGLAQVMVPSAEAAAVAEAAEPEAVEAAIEGFAGKYRRVSA